MHCYTHTLGLGLRLLARDHELSWTIEQHLAHRLLRVEPKLWHWQGLPVSIYRAGSGSETVRQDIVAAHRLK